VGGECAPYRQSERLEIYQEEAEHLMAAGAAYPCFCTDEELERKRERALSQGESPHYDGTCRELTRAEIAAKRDAGIPEVIRFRVEEGEVKIDDIIRGTVTLGTSMVGDFVLMRSNGLPTYNFAAAVDDRLMEITHVLRGEEHLPNTLRQGLLYRAFGTEPPRFGHLPLIHGEDHSKLSKRHGASSVSELRAQGFLPQAVTNYLALLGWSHSEEREVLSYADLTADFSLARVSKSPAVFDMTKLRWMNGMHIRGSALDELFPAADRFFAAGIAAGYSAVERREIFKLLQQKIDVFSDLRNFTNTFARDVAIEDEAREALGWKSSRAVLAAVAEELRAAGDDFSPDAIKAAIKAAGTRSGAKGKELYFPIRAAVTGSVHGPDLAGVIAVKGRKAALSLLEKALRSE
jgi:nondiscriminating glutamyl-tRNA synthetase